MHNGIAHLRTNDANEHRFEQIMENVQDMIGVVDINGIFTYTSPSYKTMLGYDTGSLHGRSAFERIHPDDVQATLIAFETAMKTRMPGRARFRYLKADGSYIWLEATGNVLLDDTGAVTGGVLCSRDISAEIAVEQQLHLQTAFFQQLFNHSPDAIVILSNDDRVLDANHAFGELFEYDAEEARGKSLTELVVPREYTGESTRLLQRALSREVVRVETLRRSKSGQLIAVSVTVSPILLDEDEIGVYVIYRDITQRKNAEATLRQLSVAVEQSPASIIITDPQGAIQYVNRKFTEVTGYTAEEVFGKNPRVLKSGETDSDVYRQLWETITAGGEWYGELHNKTKHGELYWEAAHISPIKDDNGVITHYLAVKEDISEKKHVEALRLHLEHELRTRNADLERTLAEMKHMQAGLIQSEKMASIGLLTAGIAHEINNPLAFISSNLNRFKEYFDDTMALLDAWKKLTAVNPQDELHHSLLAEVQKQEKEIDLAFIKEDFCTLMQHSRDGADRIKAIVEQLRGFCRMSDSAATEASINQALDDTVTFAWNEIKYKATVHREYQDIPPIACNLGELKQVFVNLLVNAAHAIQPMGVITLRTSVHKGDALIEIADTGCGIPPEHLRKIFDPFFTTKEVGKGTGLGLWISATLVHKHGGTISVESTVGKGTTFRIQLPYKHAEGREKKG